MTDNPVAPTEPLSPPARRNSFEALMAAHDELFATEDDERVESAVLPGFWLRPAWLWEAEERDPLMTLLEIGGLSDEAAAQIRNTLRGQP